MKSVVQASLRTNNIEIIEVPEDYIACSCCGEWRPPSEYVDEVYLEELKRRYPNQVRNQTRTNCEHCYTDYDDFVKFKTFRENAKITKHIPSPELKQWNMKVAKLQTDLDMFNYHQSHLRNCLTVGDLIYQLSKMDKDLPVFLKMTEYNHDSHETETWKTKPSFNRKSFNDYKGDNHAYIEIEE